MIGIDVKIDRLNTLFNTKLFTDTTNTYESKGRAFVTTREGIRLPEIQLPNTTEYLDVMFDSGVDGMSFFIVEPEREPLSNFGSTHSANVDIYFGVNLDNLYPSIAERATEYLHRDVLKIIKGAEFIVNRIITGLEAFNDFDLVKSSDNLEPFYLVKFNTKIDYNINC